MCETEIPKRALEGVAAWGCSLTFLWYSSQGGERTSVGQGSGGDEEFKILSDCNERRSEPLTRAQLENQTTEGTKKEGIAGKQT